MNQRQIVNIKVVSTKYSITVYVDFDKGNFGTRTYVDGKWISRGLTNEELAEARTLALVDGKWTNWKAPRKVNTPKFDPPMDEEDAEIEAEKNFKPIDFGGRSPEENPLY
jgi:hypothetical protein